MNFHILGPLRVLVNDHAITLPGTRLPKILAALLIEADGTVPIHRLVDIVWDEDPPHTAHRQIGNLTAELRRTLSGTTAQIDRTGSGYRFRCAHDDLDARVFRQRLDTARLARRNGDFAAALAGLDSALALWAGPALIDVPGQAIARLADELDRLRLSTVEERFAVALDLGEHEPLIAELHACLDASPYRESLAVHLMLGLHAADRTAEALKVYSDLRMRLADDLGLAPGRRLRDLHTAILRDDPALPGRAPTAKSFLTPTRVVPRQLPAAVSNFVGRHRELETLDRLLDSTDDGPATAVVSGPGGAGKTALAVHWGHLARESFPDGQLYVDMRGFSSSTPMSPTGALLGFLEALGVPRQELPLDGDTAGNLYRSRLSDKAMLILVDNVRTVEQVRPLLPGSGRHVVLVTSRNRLDGLTALHDAQPIRLDRLPADDARRLMDRVSGTRTGAEPEAADRLVRLCDGLPLALRIAATNLLGNPGLSVADYVAKLDDGDRLETLGGNEAPTSLTRMFDLSYEALSPQARQLFDALGVVPGAVDSELVSHTIGLAPRESVRYLTELATASLLRRLASGRFEFHDLVRLYAQSRANRDPEVNADRIRGRLADWYQQNRTRYGPPDLDNVLAVCRALADHPDSAIAVEALNGCINLGYRISEITDTVTYLLERARSLGHRLSEAYLLMRLGIAKWMTGELDIALSILTNVFEKARGLGDARLVRLTRSNLALVLIEQGEVTEAEPLAREGLRAAERMGDEFTLHHEQWHMAGIFRHTGAFDACDELLRQQETFIPRRFPHLAPFVFLSRAMWCCETGELTRALQVASELGDHPAARHSPRLQANRHLIRSEVYRRRGEYESAQAECDHAAEILRGDDLSTLSHTVRLEQAQVRFELGDLETAADLAEAAAGHFGRSGHRAARAKARHVLCLVMTATGRPGEAIDHGRAAWSDFSDMGLLPWSGRSLVALAAAHRSAGDPIEAGACLDRARRLFGELGLDHSGTRYLGRGSPLVPQ